MPLTENGYARLTYNEILAGKIQKAKELFGNDIDTSELTPLGKYIRINAYDQALLEEEAEAIYYARFPNTAKGTSLDRLCVFAGISRNPAIAAEYLAEVTGTPGKTVPAGFLVGTVAGIHYYNLLDTEIGEDGKCAVSVSCTQPGIIGNVDFREIQQIINPNADISSVKGVSVVVLGTDEESDYELRKRFENAREGSGSCNVNAIKAALSRIPTVTSAGIIENNTEQTDGGGRPPHTFECYISGGEGYHQEIAQTIFEKKPLGIKTHGQISCTVLDEGGYEHNIKFSHTAYIDITISVKLKKDTRFQGEESITEIKDHLMTYINNLGVGADVILSSLYGQIHSVVGVTEVTELTLSTNGTSFQTGNIAISDYQIARCVLMNIEVVS